MRCLASYRQKPKKHIKSRPDLVCYVCIFTVSPWRPTSSSSPITLHYRGVLCHSPPLQPASSRDSSAMRGVIAGHHTKGLPVGTSGNKHSEQWRGSLGAYPRSIASAVRGLPSGKVPVPCYPLNLCSLSFVASFAIHYLGTTVDVALDGVCMRAVK